MKDFAPIELVNPTTGKVVRLARSYDTMLYDTVLLPMTTLPAGRVANLFTGALNGFAAKTGADEDDLIVSSKLPEGAIALCHSLAFKTDVQRPMMVPGNVETIVSDILAIQREVFAALTLNGNTRRQLGRISFYPPWWSAHEALGGQATGGIVAQSGQKVEFEGPVLLGAWGSSQIQLALENARAVTYETTSSYFEIVCCIHATILNPVSEGDGY